MIEIRFVYQNLTEEQKKSIIDLWISTGVVSFEEALNRVEQASVLILSENTVVGVSTIYPGVLKEDEQPWFFFRMFIKKEFRGNNSLRTYVMQLNFTQLIRYYGNLIQGVVIELENTKLSHLGEKSDYFNRRGYTYFGKSRRGLQLWYVRFDEPNGIFRIESTKDSNVRIRL